MKAVRHLFPVLLLLALSSGLLAQTPLGGEILVSHNRQMQFDPHVATNARGDFLVTWLRASSRGFGLYARRYSPAGVPMGPEIQVLATGASTGQALLNEDRSFVVVSPSGQARPALVARWFGPDGSPRGGEVVVSSHLADTEVALAGRGDGGLVVVSRSPAGIVVDVFGPDHAPLGAEILVASNGVAFAPYAAVVGPTGDFMVAWENWDLTAPAGSWGHVSARLFTADGDPLAGPFQANSTGTAGEIEEIRAGTAQDGSFFLFWHSVATPGVFGRRFAADGDPLGEVERLEGVVPVSSFDAAVQADGSVLVAWNEEGRTSLTPHAFVRRYGPDGLPIGPRAQADKVAAIFQSEPVLGLAPDGRFIVAWSRGRSVPTDIVVRRFRK
jgi:hypothetical protein